MFFSFRWVDAAHCAKTRAGASSALCHPGVQLTTMAVLCEGCCVAWVPHHINKGGADTPGSSTGAGGPPGCGGSSTSGATGPGLGLGGTPVGGTCGGNGGVVWARRG